MPARNQWGRDGVCHILGLEIWGKIPQRAIIRSIDKVWSAQRYERNFVWLKPATVFYVSDRRIVM
jgi:hypothetical protein